MRLFIVRHADPDYPNKTITAAGHREAAALAERMKQIRPDRIYCSPLGRAVHTMEYSAKALGMDYTIADWTQELADCDTTIEPWGRLMAWDVPGEIVREKVPYPSYEDWPEMACLSKEAIREAFERVRTHSDAFLAEHGYVREGGRYWIERGNREKIAVFCHGGFGLTWLAHLLEIPLPLMWAGFFLPPSSVTTVLFDERSKEWAVPRCVGLGDVSHLYAAGLPVQPSGIKANAE